MSLNQLNGIEAVGGLKGVGIPESILTPQIQQPINEKPDFGQLLQMAIKSIHETSVSANEAIEKLAAGQNIELHNVVLAAQKSYLTLQLALQIKNKITDAYQEIMRMTI